MARRREFVRGAAAISSKRLTSWFEFLPINDTETASGGTIIYSLNAAALALRPFTIIRTRWKYLVVSDQAAAVETQAGAIGMAVVSDQAVAVGVTAVPTPITDMGSDLWFLHEVFMGRESNLTDRAQPAFGGTIDSKAMRKVDIGQDLVVVSELSANVSSGGYVLSQGGRMLVKVN